MSKKQKHQGWVASLSNGETIFETQNPPGEPSAWQSLLMRVRKNPALHITQLRLQRAGKEVICKSRLDGAEGYFQAYELRSSLYGDKKSHYQGVGWVEGDMVFIAWMNQYGQVWLDKRPLAKMEIHTDVAATRNKF